MDIDVSLILCLHREGKYLLRTLRSLKEAANFAHGAGLKTELIVVLDCSDELTRKILFEFDLQGFGSAEVIHVDNGSLGPSRNDGCARARGKYFMLCDGDDLVSFNYVLALFLEAERQGAKTIIVPGWVMDFGNQYCVSEFSNLDDVTPFALMDKHPYTSRTFFRRELFDNLKFADIPLTAGYAYEDWHFHANAIGMGYTFEVAPDAILFYRFRGGSLLRQANQVSVRQIPPSVLFAPETYLRVCARAAAQLRKGEIRKPALRGKARLNDPSCRLLLAAANRIEPKIEINYLRNGLTWFPIDTSKLAIGQAYYEICCRIVGLKFSHVFLLPYFGVGGAERYFSNIINTIRATQPNDHMLVLLGESHPSNEWLSRLPDRVTVLNLAAHLPTIGVDGVDLIALKLIQSCGADALIHIRQSSFGQRFFEKYGRALQNHKRIFYYFCEEIRPTVDFGFVQPWSFGFVSENFEHLDRIVSCNHHIATADQERLGFSAEKWKFLPTMHNPPITRAEAVARALQPSKRVLWASRLSWQKRPSIIRAIALQLWKARPDLYIDVYGGHPVEFDSAQLADLPNLSCHGPYDNFSVVAERGYFCFLYTSLFDGIPTVLLEAAGSGLAIIAPEIPGVGEFIDDGAAGLLIESVADDYRMARSYVTAIGQLADYPEMRARLAGEAYDRVMNAHSTQPYTAALMDVLNAWDAPHAT